MGDAIHDPADPTARRSFFRRVASVALLGFSGLVPAAARAQTGGQQPDGLDWPGTLKGRHRQVTDAFEIDGGAPLAFTQNFLAPNESATAVIIFRHRALPFAIGSAIGKNTRSASCSRSSIPRPRRRP